MSSLTGRVFGYYHILDRIGQGGMGTVYRALNRKTGLEVAVKFISPAIAEQDVFLQRFRREVKAVARLHHPHIVPVLDYGEQRGYAYLVMPLLDVSTLLDHLQQGPVSLELGARVMDQVSGALAHAHRHGIIHRDVKPSNILLDRNQNALLSDFGLARLDDTAASLTGAGLVGTPAYMAPEQATGGTVDARADQYALGVVLFYLATGSLPFTANTPMEYLLKHANEPFPAARAHNPRVPEPVERVIFRATAKKPEHRFGSVSEMNHALQTALAYLRDPIGHEAPTIELPGTVAAVRAASGGEAARERTAPMAAAAGERTASPDRGRTVPLGGAASRRTAIARKRRSPLRLAAAVAAGVLLILAVPVFASGLLDLLGRASSPAEGSLTGAEPAQLTLQAGTIAAMSTELAGSQSDPAAIQTAIALTLTAAAPVEGGGPPSTPEASASVSTSMTPTIGLSGGLFLADSSSSTPPLTQTGGQSNTPLPGTATNTPVTPNRPPGPVQTTAPAPGPSATPTPTNTPTLTATPTFTPTSTSTWTPVPTSTQTPAPTDTPIPPTQDPCPSLDLGGFQVSGVSASWDLSNGSATTVTITHIDLDWPAANGQLDRIRLGSSTIWNDNDDAPPSGMGPGFTGNHSLGNGSKSLKFEFTGQAQSGGYDLQLELDPGCHVSAGG